MCTYSIKEGDTSVLATPETGRVLSDRARLRRRSNGPSCRKSEASKLASGWAVLRGGREAPRSTESKIGSSDSIRATMSVGIRSPTRFADRVDNIGPNRK